jgi:signal recognition particle receptor subunit beta
MSSESDDSKPWRRVKVVFLGNGRSGKTSLLRALADLPLEQSPDADTMHTIADKLQPSMLDKVVDSVDVELSFWDFPGQLEYSGVQNYFMSDKQTVYVIVFSATDDSELQKLQLLFWLSSVVRCSSRGWVRVMIVCTKIDLLYSCCLEEARLSITPVESISDAAASKFQMALNRLHLMVTNLLEEVDLGPNILFSSRESFIWHKKFSNVIASKEVLFVSSNHQFRMRLGTGDRAAVQTLDFGYIRRIFRSCLFSTCEDMFRTDSVSYPQTFYDLKKKVNALKASLSERGDMCACLSDDLPVEYLGDSDPRYFLNQVLIDSLKVMNDLGLLILYQVEEVQFICVQPQLLFHVLATFTDPSGMVTSKTTPEDLESHLMRRVILFEDRRQARMLRHFLTIIGFVLQSKGDPMRLFIPSALRGRPIAWKEIHYLQEAHILGRRLGTSYSNVLTSAFTQLMMLKCQNRGRMMGCAFTYEFDDGGFVFVRLLDDRSKVDVVAMSSKREVAHAEVSACSGMDARKGE